MRALSTIASLSDDALLARVGILVDRERHATADLISALGEVDTAGRVQKFLRYGSSSCSGTGSAEVGKYR